MYKQRQAVSTVTSLYILGKMLSKRKSYTNKVICPDEDIKKGSLFINNFETMFSSLIVYLFYCKCLQQRYTRLKPP